MVWIAAAIAAIVIAYLIPAAFDAPPDRVSTPVTPSHDTPAADIIVVDGAVVTRGGELIIGPNLIQRFDFHLTAINEKTLTQIIQTVTEQFNAELSPAGAREAIRLFRAYIGYKQALANVQEQPSNADLPALIAQLKTGRNIRARFFTPTESAALFGKDDQYDDYTARRLEIQHDQTIPEDQKVETINSLRATLDPQTVRDITEPTVHIALNDRVEQARAKGASLDEIHNIRTQMVGAGAAERLAQLDTQEAQWQQRVEQYKAAIEQSPQRTTEIKQMMFTPQERLRIDATVHMK